MMTTAPASVVRAAEVYAALCANALLRMDKPTTEYIADGERLAEELMTRIAAELADTDNVRTNHETGEPYVILHPHHSRAIGEVMTLFGIKFIDMPPASLRIVVTPTTYNMSVDTFAAGRQYFTADSDAAGK